MRSTVHQIHVLSEPDIPGLIQLSESVEWDYDEAEIRTVMAVGTIFGHKDENQQLVSSAAIITYEEQLASIGMVIVHPSCRGMGLGRYVTEACVKSVTPETTIMLVATPEGRSLYESMGFSTVTHVHKYLCDTFSPAEDDDRALPNLFEVTPMTAADLPEVIALDRRAIGSSRAHFLETRMNQAKTRLIAKDTSGRIIGYGFAVQGSMNMIAGPIVATDGRMAARILRQLLQGHTGKARIDVPDGQDSFLAFLEQSGFKKASQPPVMVAHSEQLPEQNGTYFGIAAQIFG